MRAKHVVETMMRAYAASDWVALKAIYHPDAQLASVAGGSEPLPAAAALEALRAAADDPVYRVRVDEVIELDAGAAAVRGRIRARMTSGRGFTDASRVWLFTFRDSKLWRSSVVGSTDEARHAYARLGRNLGLPA